MIDAAYLRNVIKDFRMYKSLGERAMAQVSDDQLHAQFDPEDTTIAIIVKHVAGNLRSRFTDFLTTDGEKPTRDRDGEFEMREAVSRAEMMAWWESSWAVALASIDALTPDDLSSTVTIRGERLLVVEVLNRLATHAAYHVGQIVWLARHFSGSRWISLSIPKNRSAEAGKGNKPA